MRKQYITIYLLIICEISLADTVSELRPVADTFVLNPGIGNINHPDATIYNYGGAGSRSVASATAYAYQEIDGLVIINDPPKGEFISLLKFDCNSLAEQHISDITLSLYISNGNQSGFGIFNYIGSGGNFEMALTSNNWEQGSGSPHEIPSNSLNGISYNDLQTLLTNNPAQWLNTFYYSAEYPYGVPMWYSYTFDLNNGYYADLLAAISRGETVTFMLTASAQSNVSFNFTTYNQNTSSGVTLRETGPILVVTADTNDPLPLISDCYSSAVVSGQTFVGGLVGCNGGCMNYCYACGTVAGDSNDYIGGLVGENIYSIQNCFWNTETSGLSDISETAGLSTEDMMRQSSFTNWDFSADDGDEAEWKMLRPGEDYPRLAWQKEIPGDAAGLYGVDISDLCKLASYWLVTNCSDQCGKTDTNSDGTVNMSDFTTLAQSWLKDR